MAPRLPSKDTDDDSTPYDVLAQEQRSGCDVRQRVAALIADTVIRPGLMATRLNKAGIVAPRGVRWSWQAVRDERDRERTRRALLPPPPPSSPQPPLTLPEVDPRDDPEWRPEEEYIDAPWGRMAVSELLEDTRPRMTAVQSRAFHRWRGTL